MLGKISHLKEIDTEALLRTANKHASRKTKRQYIKQGYRHTISLYGALKDTAKGTARGRRIEVLSNVSYNERLVFHLYNFFYVLKPLNFYTIWIYDQFRDKIKLVGRYD